MLKVDEVKRKLKTKVIGRKIIYYDEIDSTNQKAKEVAMHEEEGTILIAEQQNAGKGRLGRSFFSPKYKSLLMSIILKPKIKPENATKYTLMTAVAIAKILHRMKVKVGIKWPNDILYEGKKLIGILTESNIESTKINYIVIGIGINVNIKKEEFPNEVKEVATSMYEILSKEVSREEILIALLEEFEELYLNVDFKSILNQWKEYNVTLGKQIKVIPIAEETFNAKAIDIDEEGALKIETDKGIETFNAGEISIR